MQPQENLEDKLSRILKGLNRQTPATDDEPTREELLSEIARLKRERSEERRITEPTHPSVKPTYKKKEPEEKPDSVEALLLEAAEYSSNGQYKKAYQMYERAAELTEDRGTRKKIEKEIKNLMNRTIKHYVEQAEAGNLSAEELLKFGKSLMSANDYIKAMRYLSMAKNHQGATSDVIREADDLFKQVDSKAGLPIFFEGAWDKYLHGR